MLPLPGSGATSERSGGLDAADLARLSSGPRPGLPADPSFENPALPPSGSPVVGLPAGNEPGGAAIGPRDGSNVATAAAVSPTGSQRTDGTPEAKMLASPTVKAKRRDITRRTCLVSSGGSSYDRLTHPSLPGFGQALCAVARARGRVHTDIPRIRFTADAGRTEADGELSPRF